jgi:predicted Zn-ribbon and HTH transcriptional regulator
MRVFDEQKYVLNMLEHGFGKRMSGGDLIILAKYYRSLGMQDAEVEMSVLKFCEKFVPDYNETLYYDKISKKVRQSKDKSLRIAEDVPITENEMKAIRGIKNYRYEKVMFVMLVLGKYYRITSKSSHSNSFFIQEQPNAILPLAHTSQKKGEDIFNQLNLLGLIDYINKNDCYVIKFASMDDKSEVVQIVTDMNDIISFYPAVCEDCGKEINEKSNQISKCKSCYRRYRNKERFY